MPRRAADKTLESAELASKLEHVPERSPRPIVAAQDHFRVLDEGSMVLYLRGAQVPAAHRELKAVPAKLVDGVCVPQGV